MTQQNDPESAASQKHIAQVAYEKYSEIIGTDFQKEPFRWEDLTEDQQMAWSISSSAVRQAADHKNIDRIAAEIFDWAERKGWNEKLDLAKGTINIHCEISEAWEEIRNGKDWTEMYTSESDKGPKPEGYLVELADAMIRIMHIFAYLRVYPSHVIENKMAYNEKRPYRHGGLTC